MQLLFIRPLLEGLLGIEKNSDMSRRYGFNDGTIQKITSSRYEVMNEDSCCLELMELFTTLGCLPVMIGSEEDCDDFERVATKEMSSIKDKDILWIEPLKQDLSNNIAVVGTLLSNRVILRNGKSFQRVTEISKELVGSGIYDYRMLGEVTRFNRDEIDTANTPKNYAASIYKMLYVAQYNSFEFILHNVLKDVSVFNDGDVWIGCKIGGNVDIYTTEEALIEKVMRVGITEENPFNGFKIICRSKTKFKFGYWKTNTGIWRKIKSYSDVVAFIKMFDESGDTVEIKVLEE